MSHEPHKNSQTQLSFRRPGLTAGVDEAGRGTLAGPVVAAAVVLDHRREIPGLADSKTLPPHRREALARSIMADSAAWAIGWADRAEIDCLNILAATLLAMRRAVAGLGLRPALIRVDGNRLPVFREIDYPCEFEAVIGGDARVDSISAASILAKVSRDAMMRELDRAHPGYGFARHKGYGTLAHRESLIALGPCGEHRRSFAPVRALLGAV